MKRLDYLWRPALFLGILALLLGGVSWAFVPKDNTPEAGIQDVLSSGYLAEPVDSLDYVVLGDSIPKFAVMPPLLWKEQGIAGYVCAAAGDSMPKLVETVQDFFERQSPKAVVLETNILFRYVEPYYTAELKAERLFPVLQYHDNWKFVRLRQMLRPVKYTGVSWEKGYYLCKLIEPYTGGGYMTPSGEAQTLSPQVLDCLRQIQALCQQEGSCLVLCSLPSATNMNDGRHNALAAVSEEMGIPYLDMNQDGTAPGIDWSVHTVDAGDHLNYWGAKRVTRALGEYLVDTFRLTDHRGDPAYGAWDTNGGHFWKMAREAHGNTDYNPEEET